MPSLFGKRGVPPTVVEGGAAPVSRWEILARGTRGVSRSVGGLFSGLRGGGGTPVRVCPVCHRKVDPESDQCPNGHYVG